MRSSSGLMTMHARRENCLLNDQYKLTLAVTGVFFRALKHIPVSFGLGLPGLGRQTKTPVTPSISSDEK
jgi:hypothetical protein